MSETWIILGATSAIARAMSRELAAKGSGILLAGRDMDELTDLAQDCGLRGARFAEAAPLDIREAHRSAREHGDRNTASSQQWGQNQGYLIADATR